MKRVIDKVSRELSIPKEVVEKTYKAYWRFIKSKIEEIPIKSIETQEDLDKYKTSFNLPCLGKMTCSYNKIVRIRENINKHKIKNI